MILRLRSEFDHEKPLTQPLHYAGQRACHIRCPPALAKEVPCLAFATQWCKIYAVSTCCWCCCGWSETRIRSLCIVKLVVGSTGGHPPPPTVPFNSHQSAQISHKLKQKANRVAIYLHMLETWSLSESELRLFEPKEYLSFFGCTTQNFQTSPKPVTERTPQNSWS